MNVHFQLHLITPDIVRGIREKLGWSTADLAAKAGLAEATIVAFEGHNRLKDEIKVVAAITQAFQNAGASLPPLPE